MIEERGRVLSVEQGTVWVETVRHSACSSCQARAGCGQSVLQRLGVGARQGFIRALDDGHCRVGDEVLIAIPENAVLRGSALVYMLPLLALFAGALLAHSAGAGEPSIILAGFLAMAAAFAAVHWHGRRLGSDPAFMPRVQNTAVAGSDIVSDSRERSGY